MSLYIYILCILNLSGNQIQGLQNMFKYPLEAESQMGTDKNDENVAGYSVGAGHSVPVVVAMFKLGALHLTIWGLTKEKYMIHFMMHA